MKFTVLFICSVLALACSGFNKPVSTYDKNDSIFLHWCMEDGRWPVYGEVPSDCRVESQSRGEWDHLPITINSEEELSKEVIIAVDSVNDQIGIDVFEYQSGNMDPDVVVMAAGSKPWIAAEAAHMTLSGGHRGSVMVYNGLELQDRDDIMLHELGHILGLRHQNNKHDIMFPSVAYRVARLSGPAVKALRERYLPMVAGD